MYIFFLIFLLQVSSIKWCMIYVIYSIYSLLRLSLKSTIKKIKWRLHNPVKKTSTKPVNNIPGFNAGLKSRQNIPHDESWTINYEKC